MATWETNVAPSLKKALTRRYCVALCLVFCILLATFAVFTRQAHIAKNDAYLINISGMQRMLSQRIALMAKDIRHAKSQGEAEGYAEKLETSIERMYQNHDALTSGALSASKTYTLSSAIQTLYFGPTQLDERVRMHLVAAKAFLELFRDQGLSVVKANPRAEENVAETRKGLLEDLHRTVMQYESEASARINAFQTLEVTFFIVGLCVLLIEIRFIFQPMVNLIVSKTSALEAHNALLKQSGTIDPPDAGTAPAVGPAISKTH